MLDCFKLMLWFHKLSRLLDLLNHTPDSTCVSCWNAWHNLQLSYHKYNEARRASFVLERLQHGGALALISDAGMPGISDPGVELVRL